ncbi:D-alanyl-D-alanine carboxypeptidase/D-alanyl-D-alanine-endopeptidase [Acidipila sp. EB88]|uniref:D-alanyl-D-alanine carboxypeptidase/D-alanyl-D-alanine endopeptidase n=1 Tax=Acidipila sp. EB88 TaxID=2305226 RepID=UPI0013152C97|nr:D-alanyl-D-alanine carboxypeptidase/D-alanyl-D-alanine-endopeptidase [Acidipila sp. EB88]
MRIHPLAPSVALLLCLGIVCAHSVAHAQSAASGATASAGPAAARLDPLLLSTPAAARAHWGVSMVDAATGATLYARNDAQLLEPASNAKLFTTSTALALLGPSFTMATRVVAEGEVDAAGTLHGTLRLVGGADPTMSGRVYPYAGHTDRSNPPLAALDALAAQVLASGIRAVDGNVLADDTLFPDERYGSGWGWDDLQWEYGAPVSALVINDNVRYLTIAPGASAGMPVTASWLPEISQASGTAGAAVTASGSGVFADNLDITAVTTPAGTAPALGVARPPTGGALRVYGSLAAGGAPVHLAITLEDPAQFGARAFAGALATAGVAVRGQSLAVHRAPVDTQSFTAETHTPVPLLALPPAATSLDGWTPASTAGAATRIVAARRSVPLSDIVTVTNKVSQNLHAELLLRLLGRAEGADGAAAGGARVVRGFMTTQVNLAPEDFLLYDGSGLSTKDLVTPRALTTLLRYSTTQPWGPVLRNSLPSSGVDGTLSGRFPALRGRVQAKTGTLGEVDALSGFLTTDSGRLVIFSILCNDYPGTGSRQVIDTLLQAAASSF